MFRSDGSPSCYTESVIHKVYPDSYVRQIYLLKSSHGRIDWTKQCGSEIFINDGTHYNKRYNRNQWINSSTCCQ